MHLRCQYQLCLDLVQVVIIINHTLLLPVNCAIIDFFPSFTHVVAIGEGYQQQVQAAQDKAIAILREYAAICESKKVDVVLRCLLGVYISFLSTVCSIGIICQCYQLFSRKFRKKARQIWARPLARV